MKRIKFFASAGAIAMATLTLGSTLTFAATNSSITSNSNTSTGIHTPPTQGQQIGKKRPPAPISLSELAQALNISTTTLKSDLQSGQSILDIATQQGISESTLEQTLTTYVDSQLQAMVSSGKLSSSQAQNADAAFAKRLPTVLSHKGLPPKLGHGPANGQNPANGQGSINGQGPKQGQQMGGKRPPAPIPPSELAQALNISTSTLKSDLQSGQSILDIATQQGISESTLEQTLTTYMDSQLQAKVSSGKLSSTQVKTAEAAFAKRLPTMLSRKGLPPHSGQGPANGKRPANGQVPATGQAPATGSANS